MINLTKDNKEIIRKYYYDMYILKLNIKGIYDLKEVEKVKNFVDEKIDTYLTGISNVEFYKYISDGNHRKRRKFTLSISINDMLEKYKNGEDIYLDYIIRYYQILNVFNINTNYSHLENIGELIKSSNEYIENKINEYFKSNMSKDFVNYVCYDVIPSFFVQCGLNKIENVDDVYKEYYHRTLDSIFYNGILTNEEKNNFVMAYLKDKIDNYLNNNSNDKFKLHNYMGVVSSRLTSFFEKEERLLIEYNRYFNNRYDDTVNFFYHKYSYIVNDILKENKKDSLINSLKFGLKFKQFIILYLDNNIKGKLSLDVEKIKKEFCDFIFKDEKIKEKFNCDLARNGDEEEKEYQKNILINELMHLKDYYKEKYVYYTDDDKVNQKIDLIFNTYVDAYINGNSTKAPSSYISTRIDKNLKDFKTKYEKLYKINDTEYLFARKCIPIIINYINNNNLSGDEFTYFIEYCKNAFNYYTNRGSYKEDIREFMFKIVISYDKKFSKEVSYIKKHL